MKGNSAGSKQENQNHCIFYSVIYCFLFLYKYFVVVFLLFVYVESFMVLFWLVWNVALLDEHEKLLKEQEPSGHHVVLELFGFLLYFVLFVWLIGVFAWGLSLFFSVRWCKSSWFFIFFFEHVYSTSWFNNLCIKGEF